MSVTTERDFVPRPRSPWTGSRYQTRHRWQLDLVGSVGEAAKELRELAAELTAAHTAGWWLMEQMRSGHLLAARASRRRRTGHALDPSPRIDSTTAPVKRWRLRVVDEPPTPGQDVLDTRVTDRTPILAWTGRGLDQVGGPTIPPAVLGELDRQVRPTGLAHRLWGLVPARVGQNYDLVADGGALRQHAVQDGALVRTQETLMFQHAADGAVALPQAAAAYRRLAAVADAMAVAGGALISADDGLLQVGYHRAAA